MKKSVIITLFILFLCITTVQADNELQAAFTGTPLSGEAPLIVTFSDQSTGNPDSWEWDFGDSSTSGEQNPSHTYSTAGTYTVSLTITQTINESTTTDTETKEAYIEIAEPITPPEAIFSASPLDGEAPLTVQFTDTSTGDSLVYSWDFGDGDLSTNQNPSHIFTTAGNYTVTLSVQNDQGIDTETKTNYITVTTPPAESDPIEYTITGIIEDGDGDPITGALVLIKKDEIELKEWSDSDGSVVFTLVDGTYNVYVSASGYKDVTKTLTVYGINKTDEIEMITGNNIEFIVVDADTGLVIPGANISVEYENFGVTNNNGRLADNLKKGGDESYLIVVRKTGYLTNSTTMKIDVFDTEIEIQLQELTGSTQTQTTTPTPTPTSIPIQTYGVVDQAEMDRLAEEQKEIEAQIATLEKELGEQKGILDMIMGFFKMLFGMG